MNPRKLVLLLVCASTPAFGGADDVQELKELVEKQGEEIQRLHEELGEIKAAPQRASLEGEVEDYLTATEQARTRGVSGGWSRDEGFSSNRVRIGGYFSLEFRDDGKRKNSEFDFRRFILKVQADIADGIGFDSELEIEGGGADVDYLTGNEIIFEYAELSFQLWKEYLAFDVGVILMPWGRFNFYHDDPLNDFTDRPLVSRYITAVPFDQPGVAINGVVPFAKGWFLDYKVALVQGFGEQFTSDGGSRDARQSFREDNNNNKQWFGRFVFSPPVNFLDTLDFGGSLTYGKWNDGNDLADYGWAVEFHLKRGPWEVTGEFMWMRIEQAPGADISEPRRQTGWYVDVAYHFFPASWRGKHVLLTQESTFTLAVRVEQIDLNSNTTGSTFRDDLTRLTLGLNFRPVERSVIKITYAWQDSELAGFESNSANIFTISWATYF